MSHRTDAAQRTLAVTIANMRRGGSTNKQIALIQGIDVKRIPALVKLGEMLRQLEQTP